MKKILSLMLVALMTLSLFAIPVSASEALPAIADGDAIYAGEQSITIKLAAAETETALTDAQAALITITNLKTQENIEFTNVITGDILTLIPEECFEINELGATDKTTYSLKLGDVTKVFSVDEIFKPTFAVATTGDTNSEKDADGEFVTGIDICVGTDATFDVIDENTIVFAGYGSTIVLDYPEILNYENASLVTDVYYFGDGTKRVSATIGFNITDANKNTLFNGNKRGAVGRAGWIYQRNSSDTNIQNHARMVAIPDTTASAVSDLVKQFYGFGSGNSIAVLNPIGSAFDRAYTTSSNFSTAIVGEKVVVGSETVALPEGFDTTKKYHYSVDKSGAVGTLMINGGLVDILDTNDYYAQYNKDNSASEVAPTTGYFLFTPYVQNSKIVMQNPRLITSEFYEFETGTIEEPSIYANKDFMTVTFAEDVSKAAVSEITLSKAGDVVECTKAIDENKIIITPDGGFELDAAYSIKIGTDFGWDAKFLAEEYNKKFKVTKYWEADLSNGTIETGIIDEGMSIKASTIADLKYKVQDNKVYVQDELQSSLAIYGIVTDITNYSLTYTAEYYATQTNASTLFFNSSHTNNAIEFAKGSSLFGWKALKRNYSLPSTTDYYNKNWTGGTDVEKSLSIVSTTNDVEFGSETVTLPTGETATTYNYTLDKLGTKGILYVNNEFVDTNDIADLNASAPSTGDIIIAGSGSSAENGGTIAFSNLLVTTFKEIALEEGDIEAPSIYANKDFMTVTFAEDVSKADVDKITLTKDGVNVTSAVVFDESKVTITPVGGFELDKVYNITIGTDFGWDAKFLAEEYSKDFRVKKFWQADLSKGELPSKMDAKGYGKNVTYAVQDGKIYLKNGYTPSLWIQGVVSNLDNYSFTYTTENYGTTESILLFNSELVSDGLYYPKSKLFGWLSQEKNYVYYNTTKNWMTTGVDADNPYTLTSTTSGVTFETVVTGTDEETGEDITKTTVTLPDEIATAYNYTLDKTGTTGVLYINNSYVDTNELNALMDTNDNLKDFEAPSKGDILIGISATNHDNTTDTAVAFSNLLVTTFEILQDEIVITNVTYLDAAGETLESIKGAPAVNGIASIKNYYNEQKPLKLIAIAYAGDEMIAVDILDVAENIAAKNSASAEYSFTGLSGLTEIKVVAWDSFANLFPYCAPFVK